jgi:hypothetical protein
MALKKITMIAIVFAITDSVRERPISETNIVEESTTGSEIEQGCS